MSNSITELKEIIDIHFNKLRNIGEPKKKQEYEEKERKSVNNLKDFDFKKYLIKNRYNDKNNETKIEREEFYENLIKKIKSEYSKKQIFFYLTNGANKDLKPKRSGSNKAITAINKDFFNWAKYKKIFCSEEYTSLGNSEYQKKYQQITPKQFNCDNAGSVFYIEIKDKKHEGYSHNIPGVYHINGWDHNSSSLNEIKDVEDKEDYKKLVSSYYIAILDHFFDKIYNTKKFSILHLIQTPGKLYGGGPKTTKIFINTVCGYLFLKINKYDPNKFRISIDYEGNYNINYDDIKYLENLINEYETNLKKSDVGQDLVFE